MPTFSQPLPDQAKPGDAGLSDDMNALTAAIQEIRDSLAADLVTQGDLTGLSSSVQSTIDDTLGVVVADAAGAFPVATPNTTHKLWVGRDSSDYSAANVRDLRVRIPDADWA